ncbi:MAG: phosphoribosyl-ATP diphosphatase [Reyranellaceae bacterium]
MAKQSKKKKKQPRASSKKAVPSRKKKAAEPHALERLYQVIESRKGADPNSSYTARLMAKGPIKLAQKLGEEAIEAAIEGVRGDRKKLVAESADLFYHLLALWASRGVKPAQVWAELARREGRSGLAEKAARGKTRGGAR